MLSLLLFCSGKYNKRRIVSRWRGFSTCSTIGNCLEKIKYGGAGETKIEELQQDVAREIIFVITAYCKENYPHICNDGNAKYTATMTTPTAGRTIAVDPSVIPYGTSVEIEGIGVRIAEDCGGAIKGNRIDLLFDTHQEALNFGRQTKRITILN